MAESNRRQQLDREDAMAELSAVRNASSRRGQTSITHLLSYSMPSSSYRDHNTYSRSYRRNPTWGPGSGHHAADKARYVHANYRFVVSPEGTYAAHAVNADEHLDWNNVLQVIASTESQAASCPICLSEPVAPRMAKCGHIFCLPCLIRFMNSMSNDEDSKHGRGARWKKCPICEDSVFLHEVRPLRFYAGQESPLPRVGDDVVLRLMGRSANSTLALPRESGADALSPVDDIPWHFAANVLDYARIMKGTGEYMSEQYEEEIRALLDQEKADEIQFGEDGEWTQKAVKTINAAKEKASVLVNAEAVLPGKLASAGSASAGKSVAQQDFYFYSSPPHLYLSPLDIRILKTKYGSFSSFPSTLLPRVEHISTGHAVDDAMRKRAKYLGHIPRGCLISFLECDWTDIVSAELLETFAEEIEKRRKRNNDKAAQEERERLQAERLEAAALRSSMPIRRTHDPVEDETSLTMDLADFQPLVGHAGSTPPNPRNGFSQLADISTSPSAPRTVWGTPAVPVSPILEPTSIQHLSVDDGWLKDDDLLGAAELAVQMEAIAIENTNAGIGGGAAGGGGGGKKKKKQKITLMSTGGRRGN
jgi:hypothetical protein